MIKQIGLPLRGLLILLMTRMITDRIGLHSVLLPLLIVLITSWTCTVSGTRTCISLHCVCSCIVFCRHQRKSSSFTLSLTFTINKTQNVAKKFAFTWVVFYIGHVRIFQCFFKGPLSWMDEACDYVLIFTNIEKLLVGSALVTSS